MQIQFIKNKLLIFELDYKYTICQSESYFLPSKRRVKLILWSGPQLNRALSDSSSVRSFPRLHRSPRESHPQHGPSGQRRSCRNPGSVPAVHEEPRNQTPALLQTPVHTHPAAADTDLSLSSVHCHSQDHTRPVWVKRCPSACYRFSWCFRLF